MLRSKVTVVPITRDDERVVVEEIVTISDDFNTEYRRQASNYAYVAGLHARAKVRTVVLKNQLKLLTAQLRGKARAELKAEKPNKDTVDDWVTTRSAFQKKQRELEEATGLEEELGAVVEALEHKREALMGLGANYRKEMDPELRLMAERLTGIGKTNKGGK